MFVNKKNFIPNPTYIYRIMHFNNLEICLRHSALLAPKFTTQYGLVYKAIHNPDIQARRMNTQITCNSGTFIHDYVPFYFGRWSPMLLQLKTGQVKDYNEGQEPIIYLISTVQNVEGRALKFVFSDGHGSVALSKWYNTIDNLDQIDWEIVDKKYWADNLEDGDRKRRKQAEFLIYRECPWNLIMSIAVINNRIKLDVEKILNLFPKEMNCPIQVRPKWYY